VTEKVIPKDWLGTGVCIGDYDNDGWDDLFAVTGAQRPLHNNGDGTFTDVTKSGPGKSVRWGSVVLVDYDRRASTFRLQLYD
jgi:hypothetical protein